jgi:hypothetical protein
METDAHTPPLPAEAVAALERGNKIEAIKLVRQAHGIGLKEAKDAVDAYESRRAPARRAGPVTVEGNGRPWWILLVVAAAALAYFLLNGA